jgi:RimJ/RimL family protein N-acetyltransferase
MSEIGPAFDEVRLRNVLEDDLPVFFEYQRDSDATAMADFAARDLEAHMAHWRKILADDTIVIRTILSGAEVAGNVVSWVQDGHREIGYWVGKQHWGKGVATAAVGEFVGVVTERPLYAWVAEHNTGSIRVLEKCGFTLSLEQPHAGFGEVTYVVLELLD